MSGRVAKGIFYGVGTGVCIATLIPLLRSRRGWVRAFDFPRMQVSALGAVAIGAGVFSALEDVPGVHNRRHRVMWGLLGLALAVQAVQIFPYTRLAHLETLNDESGETEPEVRLLFFNVLQSNRQSEAVLRLVERHNPGMILLTETDHWWAGQLESLAQCYPYSIRQPQENTYGMMLFSKFPLSDSEVRFLVEDDVPSIRTHVELAGGERILFYGVHPKPPGQPMRNGELRPAVPRDTELVLVAKEIKKTREPVIVAGDFNDVAWSRSTHLFKRVSGMLDPRVGRGLYNTFPVKWPILRYPLDHLFHTNHFKLLHFKRLPEAGSDHFPVLGVLRLAPSGPEEQKQEEPKAGDVEEVRELADNAAH